MKTIICILLLLTTVLSCFGCSPDAPIGTSELVDDRGETVHIEKDTKVAALHASFAECWLLAGGELVGVTSDAKEDRDLLLGDAEVVGTAKSVNAEALVATGAEVVFLSLDLVAHADLEALLSPLGIECAYFRIDTFFDYSSVMKRFTEITGRDDLYERSVTAVGTRIDEIKAKAPSGTAPTVLLLRVYSTGNKAKSDDNIAGIILKDLGACNVIDTHPSSLEEISLEYIAAADPEYIFILTMGDESSALGYLEANFESNRVWQELDAYINGRIHILPKDLYHYKPCERWAESYEYIAKILYPEIFG